MTLGIVTVVYLAITALLLPFFTYLGLVSISSLFHRRRPAKLSSGTARFLIVIPAHDEQDSIATTIRSCRLLTYDPRLFRVVVIADNCTDRTAELARLAGAEVIERFDAVRRSKGYALEDVLIPENICNADAAIVIDADTSVDTTLLSAFARAISSGYDWMQCYYTVRNPDASWRTRLMTYAFSLFNGVSLLGQEGLGLGAGFKGNGMCFTTKGLGRVPWKAFGLVEDMEFAWHLHALGERIHFLPETRVYGEMVSKGGTAAISQRRRWEAGRRSIPRKYLGVVAKSVSLGLYRKIMYMVQLTLPPLVTLVSIFLLAVSLHLAALSISSLEPLSHLLLPIHGVMAGILLTYVLCPVIVMGLPVRYLADLLRVPYFATWKLAVSVGRVPSTWVRTQRESSSRDDACRTAEQIFPVAAAEESVG